MAKQAASLQTLSGGRLVLGVGVGSHPGEYEQSGVDYHTRGRLLDAGIAELRRSWAIGPGRAPAATPGTAAPARYRQLPAPPPIPVWVGRLLGGGPAAGGHPGRRVDAPVPQPHRVPARPSSGWPRRSTGPAGRPDAVTPSMVLFVTIDDDAGVARQRGTGWMSSLYGIPAKAFDRHLVHGTAAEVADVVASFRSAGAEHVAVYVTADRPLDQFERLVAALPAAGAPLEARG